MKLNYKYTLQYKEDDRVFGFLLGLIIGYFSVFILFILGTIFFFKQDSLQSTLITILFGIFFYSLVGIPLVIKTIKFKKYMNSIARCIDQAYVFQSQFDVACGNSRFTKKFDISFEYKGEVKTLTTSRIYNYSYLENSLVEAGYIEELDKIIVIKKIR